MARYVRLEDRAVLSVAGEDARSFLQGLITNDVDKTDDGSAVYAAVLTPQGKYLFDFLIVAHGAGFWLDCEAETRDALIKRLSMYKLRAAVSIAPVEPASVFAVIGDDAIAAARSIEDAHVFEDPRLKALGARVVIEDAGSGVLERAGIEPAEPAQYDRLRTGLGVPDGRRDLVPEKSFLLENGFEELNGVDFEKGCYVGQEVTARMKHRGLVKKRLVPVRIEGAPPPPGTPIFRNESEVGEIRSTAGDSGLALLRLDAIEGPEILSAASATLKANKPDWAAF